MFNVLQVNGFGVLVLETRAACSGKVTCSEMRMAVALLSVEKMSLPTSVFQMQGALCSVQNAGRSKSYGTSCSISASRFGDLSV